MKTVNLIIGSHEVTVPEGGYFDRFRMNPNLDEVATDSRIPSMSFFKDHPKQRADTPFGESWSPNYYYLMNSMQAVFTAPLHRIRELLPMPLLPLSVFPGLGLISVNFYNYDICDIDPYSEAAISIIIRDPSTAKNSALQLIGIALQNLNFAHVLALPVTTEIARLRGEVGYGLPKWKTNINLETGRFAKAHVLNDYGDTDIAISAPILMQHRKRSEMEIISNYLINKVGGIWQQSQVDTNVLSTGKKYFPRKIDVTLGSGRMSDLLRQFEIGKPLRLDVTEEAQSVLYLPQKIKIASF